MTTDEVYWSWDDGYAPFPTIFATWNHPVYDIGKPPNPCRKYHVSSEVACAGAVARVALPILREMKLYHKIVKSRSQLTTLQAGDQAGKFITIYATVDQSEGDVVKRLGPALAAVPNLRPSRSPPRYRQLKSMFMEQPLDDRMFIYGGYVTDPNA